MKLTLVAASFCALLAFGAAGAVVQGGVVATPAPPDPPVPAATVSSNGSAGSGTFHGQAAASPQSRLQYCNVLADKEGMGMAARKTFMTACLKN